MVAMQVAVRPRFLEPQAFSLLRRRLRLSPREGEIVECVFQDVKESLIARRLQMSPHTLRTHMERLYHKLGIANRMELAVRLYESFLMLIGEPGTPLSPVCSQRAAGCCPLCR